MEQRLKNNQIELIYNKYKDNIFYNTIVSVCKPIESKLVKLMPHPEEFFLDILRILDDMKSNTLEFKTRKLPILWDSIFTETCYADSSNNRFDNELQKKHYATIIIGITIFLMHLCDNDKYFAEMKNALTKHLIEKDSDNFNELLKDVSVRIEDHKVELQKWINEYMSSKVLLSLEIINPSDMLVLPKDIDRKRTRIYFTKAINANYMIYENEKFRWIGTGKKFNKSELAYFCGRVFNYIHSPYGNDGPEFPGETLDKLFGVKRLYDSLTQAHNAKREQVWRKAIDDLFD